MCCDVLFLIFLFFLQTPLPRHPLHHLHHLHQRLVGLLSVVVGASWLTYWLVVLVGWMDGCCWLVVVGDGFVS